MTLWIKSLIKAYRVSQQLFVQSKMPVFLKRHMLWFFGTNTHTMQKIIKRKSINLSYSQQLSVAPSFCCLMSLLRLCEKCPAITTI